MGKTGYWIIGMAVIALLFGGESKAVQSVVGSAKFTTYSTHRQAEIISRAPATTGSALLLGNGSGGFSSYAGSSCGGNTHVVGIGTAGAVSCDTTGGIETIQDETVDLNQRVKLNFTGAGITCTDNAGQQRTDCTVPSTKDTTAVTGLLKGNGTAISAATSGTDYALINGTGFVKATGTTLSYDNSTYLTSVSDATITTTDVTTNNASTSKHGFFPKLPASTGKFLKDDLTWATIAGGGDMLGSNNLSDVANATTARNNILPAKTGNALKVLRVNSGETDYEVASATDGSYGVVYTYNSNTTTAQPEGGEIRFNAAPLSSATLMRIQEGSKNGVVTDGLIDILTVGSILKVADKVNPESYYTYFQVTGTFTSGRGSPAYDEIPVVPIASIGTMVNGADVVVSMVPAYRGTFARSPARYEQEFLHASFSSPYTWHIPWTLSAIASGTASMRTGDAVHPGVIGFVSSTTTNSGGAAATTTLTSLLLAGGEETELVFRIPTTTTNTVRFGFLDSLTSTQPTDGCWLEVAVTTASGYCKNNAGPTQTGGGTPTYTITANTWYRGKITVNNNATSVLFEIFTMGNTTPVWSGTVAANIPTATGRETGHGVVATNSGTTAVSVLDIDYMSLIINRNINR